MVNNPPRVPLGQSSHNVSGSEGSLFEETSRVNLLIVFDKVLALGIMCFSIYVGVRLWSKQQGAVKTAKIYLIVFFLHGVITGFLPFMAELPNNSVVLSQVSIDAFQSVMSSGTFSLVWYSYLSKSRRVKNTFPG